jgi:hypothetical protein
MPDAKQERDKVSNSRQGLSGETASAENGSNRNKPTRNEKLDDTDNAEDGPGSGVDQGGSDEPQRQEAVMRPSQRLSPAELIEDSESGRRITVEVPVKSREKAVLCLDGRVGNRDVPCEIVRETLYNQVIRLDEGCLQPSGRSGTKGQELKVPKHAIRREEQELTQ